MIGNLIGAKLIPIDNEDMESEIRENFVAKIVDINLKALKQGIEQIGSNL